MSVQNRSDLLSLMLTFMSVCMKWMKKFIIKSTPLSRPNKASLSVHLYVCPYIGLHPTSVHKKVLQIQLKFGVCGGRGLLVMHNNMSYDHIQGHEEISCCVKVMLEILQFSNLSPLPFAVAAGRWLLVLTLYLNWLNFYICLGFCVTWAWTWTKIQMWLSTFFIRSAISVKLGV